MCGEFQNEGLVSDSEGVSQTSPYQTIKEHFEAGEVLTDDELDIVADVAVEGIKNILHCFGEDETVIDEYEGDDGELILNISGGDLAVLIGRHGRVLDAIQLLISSLVTRTLEFHYPIVVDIEGYKARRRNKVQSIALSSAERVKKYGRSVSLKPMNAYERRLVHVALLNDEEVSTFSKGNEPMRYVVITPAK